MEHLSSLHFISRFPSSQLAHRQQSVCDTMELQCQCEWCLDIFGDHYISSQSPSKYRFTIMYWWVGVESLLFFRTIDGEDFVDIRTKPRGSLVGGVLVAW